MPIGSLHYTAKKNFMTTIINTRKFPRVWRRKRKSNLNANNDGRFKSKSYIEKVHWGEALSKEAFDGILSVLTQLNVVVVSKSESF